MMSYSQLMLLIGAIWLGFGMSSDTILLDISGIMFMAMGAASVVYDSRCDK